MEKDTKKELEKLNIYQKILAIQSEMETVNKNLKVEVTKANSYKAVSERDVLDAVKKLEKQYGVYSYPYERKIIENTVIEKISSYNGESKKTNSYFMRMETTYRFVNVEEPTEYIDVKTFGDGIDTGDKAPGKAMTYADKYALMKTYKISTGDDPDKDPSPENGYDKPKKTLATPKQVEMIETLMEKEMLVKVLNKYKVKSASELDIKLASEIISKLKEGK